MENIPTNALRTSTVLEILDRTFRLYREKFWSYAGLAAIVTVPLSIINLLVSQSYLSQVQNDDLSFSQQQAATTNYTLAISLVALVISIVQAIFINGTLAYIASEHHLGRNVTIIEAFRQVRGRFFTLFLALFIFYLVIIALAVVSTLTLACIVGILGFGFLIYVGVSINAFLAPTIVLENVGVFTGINRSFGLAKARFWSVFGLIFLIFIISVVLQLAFTVLQQLFSDQVVGSASSQGGVVVATMIETVIAVFITPITPIAFTLMYYDTRIRLEGLDIALASIGKPDARPSDIVSPPAASTLKGKDFANILILVGGGLLVSVLLGATLTAIVSTFIPNLPIR
jgi:hypothetical protein